MALLDTKIGFIGFGNMASAMADGWIAAGMPAENLCACADHYGALCERCERRGMVAYREPTEVVDASDVVIAAVKPYMIAEIFGPLADKLAGKTIVSVAWGWDSAKWNELLPDAHHLSTVPNTPVAVNSGVIVTERTDTLADDERVRAKKLLEMLGTEVEVESKLLWVGGTTASCAPAFVAMAIEALADGAVKNGIPRADAYKIVSAMVAGTASLQLATGTHPAAMKDAVCSPGGATIKGCAVLEAEGMRSAFIQAIDATLS